jgi:hypothetical protein
VTPHLAKLIGGSLAAAVLVSGLGVAPAQAAPTSSSFSLSITIGDAHTKRYCLSNSQVRSALRKKGFTHVSVVRDLGRHRVLAVAIWKGRWYQLRVNTCTGDIDARRVSRDRHGQFIFEFNFGGFPRDRDHDHGLPPGGGREELVCLVTFLDESDVAAGADADVESARVLPRSAAEALDRPNDRRAIFDYGSDAQTRDTCDYLDNLND